jgi:hypothetical protein
MKKITLIFFVFLIAGSIFAYTQLTLFVVQPIGAVPNGVTLVISRTEKTNFIDSADSICERIQNGVSLLCRGMVLAQIGRDAQIFVRLPFSEYLYSMSTNGKSD